MSIISILPEHIANQIAAGEVVEGPASIIKELVENSIDAQATKVYIEVSKQLLRVQVIDNGLGISPEDLPLAFKRHATSKLHKIEDLETLLTNGFRGEALASIAAVSKLECISKREEDTHATKITIQNGEQAISQVGASNGTNILVDDLFFNTPARLKFLKSNTKERTLILDTVRALAVANPQIQITLKLDGRETLSTSGSGDQSKSLSEIFNLGIASKLSAVKFDSNGIKISGFTSLPELTRTDKRGIFTIVNKRIVKCYIIRSAVESVYRNILPPGKFPLSIINLDIDPALVDVNVHPTKQELRYANTNQIYTLVGDAVSKAISDSFYQSTQSFQPSFNDYVHQSSQQEPVLPIAQERLIVPQVSSFEDALLLRKSYKEDFSFSDSESLTQKKFLGRLGSVEISYINPAEIKSQINTQGNRSFFTIVEPMGEGALVLKGDFVGENWLRDRYMELLQAITKDLKHREFDKSSFGTREKSGRSRPDESPANSVLEKIWERDHYTCVYCAKPLLHPSLVKSQLLDCSEPDLLQSHSATYDHYLPASKYASLNTDERNLYASCRDCNLAKSDSLASQTWSPRASNAWTEFDESNPLIIGNLKITHHTHLPVVLDQEVG